jgi:hypothetical protein
VRELFFVVADGDIEAMVTGFLQKKRADLRLDCAAFEFDAKLDLDRAAADKDSGLYVRGAQHVLRRRRTHAHVVVMLDADWDGSPGAAAIDRKLREDLRKCGCSDEDNEVIVLEPEIEAWMWVDKLEVAREFGFESSDELRTWLTQAGFELGTNQKPLRPKEALHAALRAKGKPRSSSTFAAVAAKVSLNNCQDPALLKLRATLQRWFPAR